MATDLRERRTVAVPQVLLDAIVRHYDPIEIIVFGSQARGEAGPVAEPEPVAAAVAMRARHVARAAAVPVAQAEEAEPEPVVVGGGPATTVSTR